MIFESTALSFFECAPSKTAMQEQCSLLCEDVSMTPPPATRAQARERTQQRILELGRAHLTRYGAASLSLRAIARDLDLVSSAVYRYVASRDDLLTLLVVDAYTELADQVTSAHAAQAPDDFRAQVAACCREFRRWAVAEPARYALLYGSPVPGYQAPAEQTTEPGTRVIGLILRTVASAAAQNRIQLADNRFPAPIPDLDVIRAEFGIDLDDRAIVALLSLWSELVGMTSLEVFGQFGSQPPADLQALFTLQIDDALDRLGLHPR
jgi:AcrR family transcriptional regulator